MSSEQFEYHSIIDKQRARIVELKAQVDFKEQALDGMHRQLREVEAERDELERMMRLYLEKYLYWSPDKALMTVEGLLENLRLFAELDRKQKR